ncbi:MAG: single-stranded DNA-binding protein, partial [Spirochaetota bacterium]
GRLKQDRWTDPEGKSKSKVKIVAEHVEFKPVLRDEAAEAAAPVERQREAEAVF